MTALHPTDNGTASTFPIGVALPAASAVRGRIAAAIRAGFDRDVPPLAVLYGAAFAGLGFAVFAVVLAVVGFAWAGLPVAVLALAILFGAFLPARIADRLDAAGAAEDAEAAA